MPPRWRKRWAAFGRNLFIKGDEMQVLSHICRFLHMMHQDLAHEIKTGAGYICWYLYWYLHQLGFQGLHEKLSIKLGVAGQ